MATIAPVLDRAERRFAVNTTWRMPDRRVHTRWWTASDPRPRPERRTAERETPREAAFLAALPAIADAVAHVARHHRLRAAERDDFAAEVHLAMIQDDYRILARFQG